MPAISSPAITPILMTEIFSRFLTRLLEKEPKYKLFMNEWTSFKELLIQDPINLDDIFIQLARIQLNLEKKVSSSNSLPDLEPKETHKDHISKFLDFLSTEKKKSDKSDPGFSIDDAPNSPMPSIPSLNKAKELNKKATKSACEERAKSIRCNELQYPSTLQDLDHSHHTTGSTDSSFTQRSSGEFKDMKKNAEEFQNIVPDRFDVSFLKAKARVLKEVIDTHTDTFIKISQRSNNKDLNGQERTLKKVTICGQEKLNECFPECLSAGLENAFDELAARIKTYNVQYTHNAYINNGYVDNRYFDNGYNNGGYYVIGSTRIY